MNDNRTVGDLLERVRSVRRKRRCRTCETVVSIRGFRGEYRWECSGCDALGIGYASRGAAVADIR